MGGVHDDVISCSEYLETCVDGGMLENQELMVHHAYLGFIRWGVQPTSRYSWSGDRPDIYINWSSSRDACHLDSRTTVNDSQVVDQLSQQLTMSWMHGRSGRASLSIQLDNIDLTESTLIIDSYMWTCFS
jgi:hypothetical protein